MMTMIPIRTRTRIVPVSITPPFQSIQDLTSLLVSSLSKLCPLWGLLPQAPLVISSYSCMNFSLSSLQILISSFKLLNVSAKSEVFPTPHYSSDSQGESLQSTILLVIFDLFFLQDILCQLNQIISKLVYLSIARRGYLICKTDHISAIHTHTHTHI